MFRRYVYIYICYFWAFLEYRCKSLSTEKSKCKINMNIDIYKGKVNIRIKAQCAAVCCSVLQCVAVCCSVLQCVAMCCSVLQCLDVYSKYTNKGTVDDTVPCHLQQYSAISNTMYLAMLQCALQCVLQRALPCVLCVLQRYQIQCTLRKPKHMYYTATNNIQYIYKERYMTQHLAISNIFLQYHIQCTLRKKGKTRITLHRVQGGEDS